MELKSPVLLISSQNRTGQGTDELTSLKESGDIEYSGDSVTFLVDQSKNRENRKIELSIKKNRFGETTKGHLTFIPNLGIFRDE
jgi:replicative DNA helicase